MEWKRNKARDYSIAIVLMHLRIVETNFSGQYNILHKSILE